MDKNLRTSALEKFMGTVLLISRPVGVRNYCSSYDSNTQTEEEFSNRHGPHCHDHILRMKFQKHGITGGEFTVLILWSSSFMHYVTTCHRSTVDDTIRMIRKVPR